MEGIQFKSVGELNSVLTQNVNNIKLGLNVMVLLIMFSIAASGDLETVGNWFAVIFGILFVLANIGISMYVATLKQD